MAGKRGNVDFVCADVSCLPIADGAAALAISIAGIEYLRGDRVTAAMKELQRVTNGRVLLTFTSENIRSRLYYRLGLYRLRYSLARINHKIWRREEVESLAKHFFEKAEITEKDYTIFLFGSLL
jgi:ubiquinone/menaquinone biosynthesis C-methylase UbiE